jgi:hypothetical protein
MAWSQRCYIKIKNNPLGIQITGVLRYGYESYVVDEVDGMGRICTLPFSELPTKSGTIYEDDTITIRI